MPVVLPERLEACSYGTRPSGEVRAATECLLGQQDRTIARAQASPHLQPGFSQAVTSSNTRGAGGQQCLMGLPWLSLGPVGLKIFSFSPTWARSN